MAEDVHGNFTFTILDENNTLYFVKGSSPLHLIYFEKLGLYIYSSTESIMNKALKATGLWKYEYEIIPVYEEDILSIDIDGNISKSEFEAYRTSFYSNFYSPYDDFYNYHEELLLEMCGYFGVDEEDITALLEYGYTSEEIEDMLMDNDLIIQTLSEIRNADVYQLCEGAC